MTCPRCKCEVVKNRADKRPGGGWFYVDEEGSRWDGRICPACTAGDLKDDFEPNPLTHRRCRHCDAQLRADRYFHCRRCETLLECSLQVGSLS